MEHGAEPFGPPGPQGREDRTLDLDRRDRMPNQIGKLAAEIDAAIRPWLLTEGPLSQEEQERLADLLWQLGEASGEAEKEAGRPAPASEESLNTLSQQLEWLSQEQSATRRRIAELTDALQLRSRERKDFSVKSFFTGFGLAAALTPAAALVFYCFFGIVQLIALEVEVPFLILLSVLVCVVLGMVLFLGAEWFSGRLQRWLEKLFDAEDEEEEEDEF